MRQLKISLKDNSYDIFIENGIISKANEYIKEVYKNKKVYIITDSNVEKLYLNQVIEVLKNDFIVDYVVIPAGEESKCLNVYANWGFSGIYFSYFISWLTLCKYPNFIIKSNGFIYWRKNRNRFL